MKKLLSFILVFILLLTLVACEKEDLYIIGDSEVEVGCSIVLKHNFKNGNENWSSSDNNVAIIYNGMLIGLSEGYVTITLEIDGNIATKDIEVTNMGVELIIDGINNIFIGEEFIFTCELSNGQNGEIEWSSSDESIASVDNDGKVIGLKEGRVTISATLKNTNNKSTYRVVIMDNAPKRISISGKNKLAVGDSMKLEVSTEPNDQDFELVFSSSDENVATVSEDGIVSGKSVGFVSIKVSSKDNSERFSIFEIEITLAVPKEIIVSGKKEIIQGEHNNYAVEVIGDNVTKQVIWETSDPTIAIVYQGIVLGVNKGKVTISAHSILDENIKGSIEVEVKGFEAKSYSKEELDRVNEILNKMTLNQKIGQMFVVGFSGTSFSNTLSNVISEYNFGNVIYMGANVTKPSTLSDLSNAIQNKMVEANGVPAFISIDQEGGRVARLTNGGTHFVSNMMMGATGDFNNTYLEGLAMGKELRNYGINLNFAPVLDVNNNPDNPIIGIRSYSDNPLLVSLYGKNMFLGLEESNVMGCSKHFPGHGNTSVDSHYGLPTITTSKDKLYQTELAPFISAVSNGIDAIMTTHIIFSAIDSTYPATLSEKVLTNLLREELGYQGLIITDGMEMGAVTNNFGGYDKTAVLAVKAGVDILLYTSNTNPRLAHDALVSAVNSGEISIERINESVRRILLKKLEYGILDNYQAYDQDISELLEENEELNLNFAMKGLTQAKGEFNGLDKNKSTLIISPSTSYSLGEGLESNSFANYASNYLKEKGHKKVDHICVEKNIDSLKAVELLEKAKEYDQIVVAFSNVKTSSYSKTAKFVNDLFELNNNLVVIALDTPYDIMAYDNINNYICVYGYQKASVIALSKYLNGEFKAEGILAVSSIK